MTTTRIVNCIRELDPYLDTKIDDIDTLLEFICQLCGKGKLTVSAPARTLTPDGEDSTEPVGPRDQQVNMYMHGFEQTVVLPCGHLFGERCIREKFMDRGDLSCPLCGFKMTYPSCGHAIAPAIIALPLGGPGSVRDTVPLTIPEGGPSPSNCKQCRWKEIRAKLVYALGAECAPCAQKKKAGDGHGLDDATHEAHRARHVERGVREAMGEIMALVQPDFVTRETETSAEKTREERDRRDANTALLNVLVLTEVEDTLWRRTATTQLTEAQAKRHSAGCRAIEAHVFDLLVDSEGNCRRMW
ncbi:hypothetical protein F5X97DRAFT_161448 [Nemania serpens]|nr:hypothetical protein F5X97DRAFT_161448 [Nemania serpens]